jgi:hypothetical protein
MTHADVDCASVDWMEQPAVTKSLVQVAEVLAGQVELVWRVSSSCGVGKDPRLGLVISVQGTSMLLKCTNAWPTCSC